MTELGMEHDVEVAGLVKDNAWLHEQIVQKSTEIALLEDKIERMRNDMAENRKRIAQIMEDR